MCPQKLKWWLIGSWDGKSQNEVGIWCIILQFCPSCKLFCNSVQWGEGLTKASTCNGTFVLEFEHFIRTGGEDGQPKSNKTFSISSTWKIFFTNRPTCPILSTSPNVHISVYMFTCPLSMIFFQGLSSLFSSSKLHVK